MNQIINDALKPVLVSSLEAQFHYLYFMLKILTDLIGALLGLILALPVLGIAMILILIFDGQNPIFIQARLGKSKQIVQIIKLRTMKNNQITPLGNILRKTVFVS